MFKIIHKSKDNNSISIKNMETGDTKPFSKLSVDMDTGIESENSNFKAEVEAFAREGFLEENNIDI